MELKNAKSYYGPLGIPMYMLAQIKSRDIQIGKHINPDGSIMFVFLCNPAQGGNGWILGAKYVFDTRFDKHILNGMNGIVHKPGEELELEFVPNKKIPKYLLELCRSISYGFAHSTI